MRRRTFTEPGPYAQNSRVSGGAHIFGPLSIVLLQCVMVCSKRHCALTSCRCLMRIKNAVAKHPQLQPLVQASSRWLNIWIDDVTSSAPSFADPLTTVPLETRKQICQHLRTKFDQLTAIVDREHSKGQRATFGHATIPQTVSNPGTIAALHNSYVGPGALRLEGPRHDNDHIDIADIRAAPTNEELLCRSPPFLPSTLYDAPHPSSAGSPERILDIQFRLLREELA